MFSSGLAPQITERHLPISLDQRQNCAPGNFADFLILFFAFFDGQNFRPRRRQLAIKQKRPKLPMHGTSRAYALHDLLPEIAAFSEIQRAPMACLLRQVSLAYIHAITRDSVSDSLKLQSFKTKLQGSCSH